MIFKTGALKILRSAGLSIDRAGFIDLVADRKAETFDAATLFPIGAKLTIQIMLGFGEVARTIGGRGRVEYSSGGRLAPDQAKLDLGRSANHIRVIFEPPALKILDDSPVLI